MQGSGWNILQRYEFLLHPKGNSRLCAISNWSRSFQFCYIVRTFIQTFWPLSLCFSCFLQVSLDFYITFLLFASTKAKGKWSFSTIIGHFPISQFVSFSFRAVKCWRSPDAFNLQQKATSPWKEVFSYWERMLSNQIWHCSFLSVPSWSTIQNPDHLSCPSLTEPVERQLKIHSMEFVSTAV